jgi:hypothetical protein
VAWAPRRGPGLLALVLLAHVALVMGWHAGLMPRPQHAPPLASPAALVWLQIALPRAAHPTTPAPRTAPAGAPPTRAPAPRAAAQPGTPPQPGQAPMLEAAPTAIHLPAPEPAASAASAPRERLMDTAATRAAIRQAGRDALLAERAASATAQAVVSGGEKEAQAVARATKGDCLKGEFAGGDMGLLSIPFLVVAGARGQCAH